MSDGGSEAVETQIDVFIYQLKQENELYRKNFETMKKQYADLGTFYSDQITKLKSQIDLKNREYDALKKQYETCIFELESTRSKLAEETDIRMRIERDITENDKYKGMYTKLKRELDLLRQEAHEQRDKFRKELQEQQLEHEQALKDLRQDKEMTNFIKSTELHKLETQLTLQRQNDDLQVKIKEVMQELEELRHEKANLTAQREEILMSHSKQLNSTLTKLNTTEVEMEHYKKRVDNLQNDNDKLNRENNRMHEQIIKLEKESAAKQNQLDEQNQRFNAEKFQTKSTFDNKVADFEREKQYLNNQLHELRKRVEELQTTKHDLQQKLLDVEATCNSKIRKILDEEESKYSALERERTSLKFQVNELEKQLKHSTYKSEVVLKRESQDFKENHIYELHSHKERLEQNVNYLQQQIRDLMYDLEKERKLRSDMAFGANSKMMVQYKMMKEKMSEMKGHLYEAVLQKKKQEKLTERYRDKAKERIAQLQTSIQEMQQMTLDLQRELDEARHMQQLEKQNSSKSLRDVERERDKWRFMFEQLQQNQHNYLFYGGLLPSTSSVPPVKTEKAAS